MAPVSRSCLPGAGCAAEVGVGNCGGKMLAG